jgi:hypothetical protein
MSFGVAGSAEGGQSFIRFCVTSQLRCGIEVEVEEAGSRGCKENELGGSVQHSILQCEQSELRILHRMGELIW